jgi:Xaa-Pro aminopeptidase
VLAIDRRTRRSTLYVPSTDPRFSNPSRPNDFPGRPLLSDSTLRTLSGVDTVVSITRLDAMLDSAIAQGGRVLINAEIAAASEPRSSTPFTIHSAGDVLGAHLLRTHPSITIDNAYALMATLRMIKSPSEIAKLRETVRVTIEAITRGAVRMSAGTDERTLTGQFVADCMSLGAQRVAFTPIIKSGPNSLWPWRILGAHYDRRNRDLQRGELVIFDVGCEKQHYVSDIGRTFPVNGRFTSRQRDLVEMVRTISDAVIAAARPGITLEALQRIATAAIPDSALPYMQAPLYFGHHIGLDAGDPSLNDAVLAAGMVITIEPWYYNHVDGVAVFLEDEILITDTGAENLTARLPRDATGLERLMRRRVRR